VKYRCDASVLVHFRGFREASVQQFVQQPRGDVSRDYLASLRHVFTATLNASAREETPFFLRDTSKCSATLTAWGMHRMGNAETTKTKLTDWDSYYALFL